ncbi:hypothetical protein ElyMa_004343000 [Elysia marginata]|uniref:Uncharacterized protein n=1 Tax=Elysia marginata TaxID=1093978 RepID=A0AAV4H1W7_9GAST|nr:hypothetical protein ElyMa_004343000 [Elysia marginata]
MQGVRARERERQTDRQKKKKKERQTDSQTDREENLHKFALCSRGFNANDDKCDDDDDDDHDDDDHDHDDHNDGGGGCDDVSSDGDNAGGYIDGGARVVFRSHTPACSQFGLPAFSSLFGVGGRLVARAGEIEIRLDTQTAMKQQMSTVLQGKAEGKRDRGRPPSSLARGITNTIIKKLIEVVRISQDRERWSCGDMICSG